MAGYWDMNIALEELHQYAHQAPGYEESIREDRQLVTVALSAGELILLDLGAALIMTLYPCLARESVAFIDRIEEIVNAVWEHPDGSED